MMKQIEEMAKIINKHCFEIMDEAGATDRDCPFPYSCEECTATNLYNAGYRKSTDVAREIFQEMAKFIFSEIPNELMPIYKERDFTDGVIFGKREAFFEMLNHLEKLRKKYESEGAGHET